MSYDGIFTRAMRQELAQALIGGRVNKIDQPYPNECILTIRHQERNYPLLLSAHPRYARVQISQQSYTNPLQPPQFVMVLRKHLNRAVLKDISQQDNDRILIFHFENRDDLGDLNDLLLVCEMMGRHSNVLLVNQKEDKILEAIRHVPQDMNSYRTLLPGATYIEAPKQDKINPFTATAEDINHALAQSSKQTLAQQILDVIQGVGKDSAEELAARFLSSHQDLKQIFQELENRIQHHEFQGWLYDDQRKQYFTAFSYSIYDDLESKAYDRLSDCLDDYYVDKANRDRIQQMAGELYHLIDREISKNKKKLSKQEDELRASKKADRYRVKGEVLTAFMHQVKTGMEEIELPNFYDHNQPLTISLDPQLSPADNAQKLFTRYNKLKKRKKYLSQQIEHTQKDLHYLESVQTQLDLADFDDIEDIREELIAESYLKKSKKKGQKKNKKAQPHHYQTTDGAQVLVGRNNKQNDQLTLKKASKHHYWLHTKDIPGSHVILQTDQPTDQDIAEAAEIAAFHSKARQSSNVEVDYVQVKHVHKPKGAKPGFVIYDSQHTIHVTPVKDEILPKKRQA